MSSLKSEGSLAVEESRLKHFPISFFTIVMGLSGVSLAWKTVGTTFAPGIYQWLGVLTSLVTVAICAIYLLKIVKYPKAVLGESKHPIMLNFFPAFSISLLLLSSIWEANHSVSLVLWTLGTVVQMSMTIYVMGSWIHHTHYTLTHANPAWFIPVVGNIIVPITGSHLGFIEISWFFFSVGIVFWAILLTIIMYRLFFHEPLPTHMTPMLFILLAPPSLGFTSYTNLVGEIDVFARVLYYVALFLSILLFSNITRFLKVPFFTSSWAYLFPVAALTVATAKMGAFFPGSIFIALSQIFLTLVTLLVSWLVFKTIKALIIHEICVPEKR